jgi:hypothetical protein
VSEGDINFVNTTFPLATYSGSVLNSTLVAPILWTINSTTTGGTYNLTLAPTNIANNPTATNLRILKRASAATGFAGDLSAVSVSATNIGPIYEITEGNRTGFSEFALGNTGSETLPVNWVSFSATRNGSGADLAWTVASELNNAHFLLARSLNGPNGNYTPVAQVAGRGTTNDAFTYRYNDADVPANANVFYRITQVDLDGTVNPGLVAELAARTDASNLRWVVTPNPSAGEVRLAGIGYDVAADAVLQVRIVSADGRALYDGMTTAGAASARVYILQVRNGSQAQTLRLVRQ